MGFENVLPLTGGGNLMANAESVTFEALHELQLPMLMEWLRRPHLDMWLPKPATVEEAKNEFLPDGSFGAARPFIAYLGSEPVGYIQYYVVSEGGKDWWPDTPRAGVVGIDQFLADGERLGKGLGTRMVSQFIEWLFLDANVTEVRVDPRPDNRRAIRCYEKVGFQAVREFASPDGPALLMTIENPRMSRS